MTKDKRVVIIVINHIFATGTRTIVYLDTYVMTYNENILNLASNFVSLSKSDRSGHVKQAARKKLSPITNFDCYRFDLSRHSKLSRRSMAL